MSPASYLTAPPRVAAGSIASIAPMSALLWASLAFFLVVLVTGSASVGWVGLRFWRTLRGAMATGTRVTGELADQMEALDTRVKRSEGSTAELQRASAHLAKSVGRARILLASAQESHAAIAGWLRFVPRP